MDFLSNLTMNLYSFAILLIIIVYAYRHKLTGTKSYILYEHIVLLTAFLLIIDILGRLDGRADTMMYPVLNQFGNFMLFLLNPVLPSLWLIYLQYRIHGDDRKYSGMIKPLVGLNIVNVFLVVLTQYYGWYYYIDAENFYHRGPLYPASFLMTLVMLLIGVAMTVYHRKLIDPKHYYGLLSFAAPPILCCILQFVFYGFSLVLNGVVISILIVFFNMQNQNIYTDYMTGVFNRKKLDAYINQMVNESTADRTFSAILLDLNNFKTINDTYGHNMGDTALQISTQLLKSCLRPGDFVARFGGDEFCIVLNVSDIEELKKIVSRINESFSSFNATGTEPFELSFSMGYSVYNVAAGLSPDEFLRKIDLLMYENKEQSRNLIN